DEVERRYPAGFARWLEYGHGWDDGESYGELGARVVAGFLSISAAHPNANVLVVTHGGWNWTLGSRRMIASAAARGAPSSAWSCFASSSSGRRSRVVRRRSLTANLP